MSCSAIRGGGRPYVVRIVESEWDFFLVEEAEWELVLESDFNDDPGNEHGRVILPLSLSLSLVSPLSLSVCLSLFLSFSLSLKKKYLTTAACLLVVSSLLHELIVDHILKQLALTLQALHLHLIGRCEIASLSIVARSAVEVGSDGPSQSVALQFVVGVSVALQVTVDHLVYSINIIVIKSY